VRLRTNSIENEINEILDDAFSNISTAIFIFIALST
jgi:hypothetical protein